MEIPIEWTPAGISAIIGVLLAVIRPLLKKIQAIDMTSQTYNIIETIAIIVISIVIAFVLAPMVLIEMNGASFMTCVLYGLYAAMMVLGITFTSSYQNQKFQAIRKKLNK